MGVRAAVRTLAYGGVSTTATTVRYKADAWPDTTRTFDLVFPEGEALSGHCAQYCGLKHSDMVFTVDAMAPAEFRAWAAEARR